MLSKGKFSKELLVQDQSGTDLQALDEKVKSMIEEGQRMIANGKQADGRAMRKTSAVCKACGKEDVAQRIRHHIQANHLEGLEIPCD